MQDITTDVLIIGSGAAGLSAAVYAAESGAEVIVVDKGASAKSGSTVGAVQIAGLGPWSMPEDSTAAYNRDILDSGRGLSDPSLTEVLARDIEERLADLQTWGLKLDENEHQRVEVTKTSGHNISRSISARKGKSGLGILQTLFKQAKTYHNLLYWSDLITLEIAVNNGKAAGAYVYNLKENELYWIRSNAVILAAGGIGQLFSITSNPVQATGDGFALGLEAGVSLLDLEQIQFYPVSLLTPPSLAGLCMSFYHLGKLFNTRGERFMKHYEPQTMEDTTRDKLAIAIAREITAGRGTPNGGVWLDATGVIDDIKTYFPHEYNICTERGVNLEKEWVEIGPAAHFSMGGIAVNANGETSLAGLYAAGETAGGLHGGNRLGNNALSECIVFGKRAGEHAAAKKYKARPSHLPSDIPAKSKWIVDVIRAAPKGEFRPVILKDKIRRVLDTSLGVTRSNENLTNGWDTLTSIQKQMENVHLTVPAAGYSREVLEFIEVQHMIETAKAFLSAAKTRTESRGAHFTIDYPDTSDEIRHTKTFIMDGRITSRYEPKEYQS
ncbi:L-aspartate oxidase [Salibacterium aidingense]|uniref:L-aspartate oxidase n=1 Tax=Salibacterium aidingense TaxID=384933 RepID=UPI003BC2E891